MRVRSGGRLPLYFFSLIVAGGVGLAVAGAQAAIIRSTFNGLAVGADQSQVPADAEVREETIASRGDLSELATRRGTTQNSVMLMRFNIAGITPGDLAANPFVALRLHVNTTSLTRSRQNSVPGTPPVLPSGTQYGLEYHALNLAAAGQNWNEANVAYNTAGSFVAAPGLTYDNNVATKDYNADTTLLGSRPWLPIPPSNHLPVGDNVDFQSAALTAFITSAITGGSQFVTFLVGVDSGEAGYNYIFGSNDATQLLADTAWDPDQFNSPPDNQASPNSASLNTDGRWAPKLILSALPVPEPTSVALAGLAALAAGALLRRRK
jgi:PEP-CTERM motif